MQQKRQDHEPPPAIAKQGWRYHHIGIPTSIPHSNERYLPHLKMYVSGFDTSPYGIEWMRFDPDSQISELTRTVPHIAFEVDDLDAALIGQNVFSEVSSPSNGVRVAMIIDDGVPIELLEFDKSKIDSK
jgi:hypothetical protein